VPFFWPEYLLILEKSEKSEKSDFFLEDLIPVFGFLRKKKKKSKHIKANTTK